MFEANSLASIGRIGFVISQSILFAAIIRHMLNLCPRPTMPNKEKENTRQIFARNFKRAREGARLTQEQVAEMMGWTQPYLSDIENSKTPISLDTAKSLADAVNQPLCKLLSSAEK